MKYGIAAQLPLASADLAQRFHAALLQRMYQVQQGATPSLADPLDCAIAAMHAWDAPAAAAPVRRYSLGNFMGTIGMLEQDAGDYVRHADVAALVHRVKEDPCE